MPPEQDYWRWLYRHVEDWWGDRLTLDLADKIASSPKTHIALFSESLQEGPGPKVQKLMEPGTLRPLVVPADLHNRRLYYASDVPMALRLLLYVHEVALESDFVNILYDIGAETRINSINRTTLRDTLRHLALLRPFALDGLVHATHVWSKAAHPSQSQWGMRTLDDPAVFKLACELAEVDPGEPVDQTLLSLTLREHFRILHFACILAELQMASPLARSDSELKVLSAILRQQISDQRQSTISSLARLPVPDFSTNAELVAKLRSDDAAFAAWRERLGGALNQ